MEESRCRMAGIGNHQGEATLNDVTIADNTKAKSE
jgi:hypothetical protein